MPRVLELKCYEECPNHLNAPLGRCNFNINRLDKRFGHAIENVVHLTKSSKDLTRSSKDLTRSSKGIRLNSFDMFRGTLFLLLSLVNFTTARLNGENFTPPPTSQPKEEQDYSGPTIFFGEQDFSNPRTTSNSFGEQESSGPSTASGEQDHSKSSTPSESGANSSLCSDAGNCTCSLDEIFLLVTCTSVGDELDTIAPQLPQKTEHL